MATERAWIWRQTLPPEEKLLLLALSDAADAADAITSRPDVPGEKGALPDLIEEAAALTGLGGNGAREVARRLHTRGLIDEKGSVRPR